MVSFLLFLALQVVVKPIILRMISGHEHVDSGQISLDNQTITRYTCRTSSGQHCFSKLCAIPTHDRVREHRFWPMHAKSANEKRLHLRVREALNMVQLPDTENRYPHQLSGRPATTDCYCTRHCQ